MKKASKSIQMIFSILLFVAAIILCIAAFLGHTAAYPAAAVCFFAATPVIIGRKRNADEEK